jgi:LemA protein
VSESVLVWVGAAVMVFWTMGAYNRLVRLRAASLLAFTAFESSFYNYLTMAKDCMPSAEIGLQAHENVWADLDAALTQFKSNIQSVRAEPLKGAGIDELRATYEALSLSADGRPCLLPEYAWSTLPKASQLHWQQTSIQLDTARTEFNQHVAGYNEAIGQFPAALLAWIFGFKQARPI